MMRKKKVLSCLLVPLLSANLLLSGCSRTADEPVTKSGFYFNTVISVSINLGGNVLALGAKTDGSAYTIGIQRPFGEENEAIASVSITDQTVVSSGVYERYFEVDGTRYHHILDTATGYPYDNGLLEVTIITGASVDGDGLSTTCFSLGLEDGMALVESLDATEAIFITDDYEVHTSSGMGTVIPYEILED